MYEQVINNTSTIEENVHGNVSSENTSSLAIVDNVIPVNASTDCQMHARDNIVTGDYGDDYDINNGGPMVLPANDPIEFQNLVPNETHNSNSSDQVLGSTAADSLVVPTCQYDDINISGSSSMNNYAPTPSNIESRNNVH
ncbi:hypothetical protein V6N13_138376 [Hibiscus sabdariffa]|uniref:Uncharacterized protein n=1 Tax=Hibiscus sabdariffa TaxID=183260 RepID=A0ABR2QD88_9ROSI